MQRIGKTAVLGFVLIGVWGCHRHKTAPPAAPVPAAVSPRPRQHRTQQATQTPSAAPSTPSSTPAPAPPAATTASQPSYRLGESLTPDQARTYNAEIDRRLQHARQAVTQANARTLSPQQKTTLAQIRDFISQAEEARRTDVAGARSLAQRADVLATDLLSTLR